jgi:DNA polymerase-3 subunit delta
MARGRRTKVDPFERLERDLAGQALAPLYVLSGDDVQARGEAVELLKTLVEPEIAALNLHLIQEGKLSAQALVDLARTFPMMGGRRVLVLTDPRLLGGDETEREIIRTYLESPSPETVIVLSTPKMDRRREPDKTLCKLGRDLLFERPREYEMGRWIAARARARGLALSGEGAEALAALVGTDTSRAMGELEKLALYTGGGSRGPIGLEEVDAVVGPGRATGIFELDDALLSRDPDRSVSVVRRHLLREGRAREALPLVLAQVARTVRNLLRAREAYGEGARSREDLAQALQVHPFVGQKLLGAIPRYRGVDLARALAGVHEADAAAKVSHPHPEALLNRVILRVTGPSPAARRGGGRP